MRLRNKSVAEGEKWERAVYQNLSRERSGKGLRNEVGQILLIGPVDRSRLDRVLGLKETSVCSKGELKRENCRQ